MTDAAKFWSCRLALYKNADNRRAVFEILVTSLAFIAPILINGKWSRSRT